MQKSESEAPTTASHDLKLIAANEILWLSSDFKNHKLTYHNREEVEMPPWRRKLWFLWLKYQVRDILAGVNGGKI